MNEEKALLQSLWRKASTQEKLTIPCKTLAKARRLRYALYNAVRGVRDGEVKVDEVLQFAVENYSISFDPDEPSTLVVQRKILTELMQTVQGILGDTPLETEEDILMREAEQRVRAKVAEGGAEPTRVTPYYTREG